MSFLSLRQSNVTIVDLRFFFQQSRRGYSRLQVGHHHVQLSEP
jgi:hypothetical protein